MGKKVLRECQETLPEQIIGGFVLTEVRRPAPQLVKLGQFGDLLFRESFLGQLLSNSHLS